VSTNNIFSSKPAQIAHATIKLSNQIFGEDNNIEIAAIGDKDLVFSIASNLKKFGYSNCSLFKKSNFFYIDSEKKKIIDKKKILKEFFVYDLILIGFNDGLKVISKDIIQVFLKYRKQKPIFFVDVGLPGNVDTEISKISNCYLFDLNDLEQFFTLFFNESNIEKLSNYGQFSKEDDKVFSYFFKKLNFSENQKKIFKNYVEDFFFENNEEYQKDAFLKFFKSFK